MNAERGQVVDDILFSSRNTGLWVADGRVDDTSGEFLAERLPILYMREHNVAGYVWDAAYTNGFIGSGNTLYHVDAHDDLALRLPLPNSVEELSSLSYSVGSFILPRVHVGIINTVVWVHPENVVPPTPSPKVSHRESIASYPDSVQSDFLARGLRVKETTEFLHMCAELLDIDLDYFTKKYPPWYPNALLRAGVRNDLQKILHAVSGVKLITVALSPGYIRFDQAKSVLEETIRVLSAY